MTLRRSGTATYQKSALVLSFWAHRVFRIRGRRRAIPWVVGTSDVASMIVQISRAIPGAYSVSFTQDHSYDHGYDLRLRARAGSSHRLE